MALKNVCLKRGFVTVATGKYYCELAENLISSYRLFSENTYPFYVITDLHGKERLESLFDGVIVMEKPNHSYLDKLYVYQNSVFCETVFLDADMHIVNDISYLFDEFEKNASSVSCVGALKQITETCKPIHYSMKVVENFGLRYYISFGGGIYYYRKSKEAKACIDFIIHDLVPNYDEYELLRFAGHMADEPLLGLSILVHGMKPLDVSIDIMKYAKNMLETLQWNMKERKAEFIWWGQKVSPSILHYGAQNTYTKKYVYYSAVLRNKQKQNSKILLPIHILTAELVLFFRLVTEGKKARAFYKWFFAHFELTYFKLQIDRLKRIWHRVTQ